MPKLNDREEAFISQWVEKIPGFKHPERAYTIFLNTLRTYVFEHTTGGWVAGGKMVTPEDTRALASFIRARAEMRRILVVPHRG